MRAVFDGEVLRPEQPVDLEPNATYVLTIERVTLARGGVVGEGHPLTEIGRLATEMGVTDLAAHHNRYTPGDGTDEPGGS